MAVTCSLTLPFSYVHWLSVIHSCFSKLSSFIVSLLRSETLSSASKEIHRLRAFIKEDPEENICTETTEGWRLNLTTDGRLYLQYVNIKCNGVYKKRVFWKKENAYSNMRCHNSSTFLLQPMYNFSRQTRITTWDLIRLGIFRFKISSINPLKTKRRPLNLKIQSVPRCKHFLSQL